MSGTGNTRNKILLTAGDMTTTLTTAPFKMENIAKAAIQAVYTGSPVGVFKIQASCDLGTDSQGVSSATNWTDLASATTNISAAGNLVVNLESSVRYIRAVYTPTSGSGSLTITANGKV